MNWLGSSTASHSTLLMPAAPDVIDGGEHVLQAVAELVEQRLHLAKRHERRLVADRRAS